MSDVLDNLSCAVTEAFNFYDEEGRKKAVEICDEIEKLVSKLEEYESDILMKSQPEYWADLRYKIEKEKE